MAWRVEFSASAGKEFDRLDKPVKERIRNFIKEKIEPDPRRQGAPMTGDLSGCAGSIALAIIGWSPTSRTAAWWC